MRLLICLLLACPLPAQNARGILEHSAVRAAFQALDRDYQRFVDELVYLTEIPAPPFKEAARAKAYEAKFREIGLRNVAIDAEGNVVGHRPGSGGPLLVVAAHLDTVFPEGTDVKVKKEGTRYAAPGIGDDTHGLAAILAVVRAMDAAQVRTKSDIVFVGDVGEEGLGNLRGVRFLFEKSPLKGKIQSFISLDGGDDSSITNGGVASKRYRVTFSGPGGHSYGAFGLVNPAFALAEAAARLAKTKTPQRPKTTFNIGVVGGGTSVNSIPHSVWMEVDMRSESPAELDKLERKMLADMRAAAAAENRARSARSGAITVDAKLVGDRKGGQTPASAPIVQTAVEITRALGQTPALRYGSTDSNVPIGMGIPAITIGSGRSGGRAHALDEWVDVDKSLTLPGLQRVLAIVAGVAGVE
jgi:acetylornithine deacetylase/succinyl-diaminopimelate desuccinylase-like protein